MNKGSQPVDQLFHTMDTWKEEMAYLRNIALSFDVKEVVKWNQPTYQVNHKNVFILSRFKAYFTIHFFNGILMKDTYQILTTHGSDATTSRVIKMTSLDELKSLTPKIKEYIKIAIDNELKGLKPKKKPIEETFEISEELMQVFKEYNGLEEAFQQLTPGRRKAYIHFFNGAKQKATRLNRIYKYVDTIMDGKGI